MAEEKKISKKDEKHIEYIRIVDDRGAAYLPRQVRAEVGGLTKGKVPYFIGIDSVLLVREDASLEDILKGLDMLKEWVGARWIRE